MTAILLPLEGKQCLAVQETWQRALLLHEWLQAVGHTPDDRLCTTLIRVCAQHGQAATALGLYDWMRASRRAGGAGLVPTVYTYTAALRAALSGNMIERAYQVLLDSLMASPQASIREHSRYHPQHVRFNNPLRIQPCLPGISNAA